MWGVELQFIVPLFLSPILCFVDINRHFYRDDAFELEKHTHEAEQQDFSPKKST